MDDQENAKGDQSDPAAKRNPVLSPPRKEDDLDDFGNFQDSETFGDFGDFGAFEGADERQSVEEQNWSTDALARPDAPANPLQMSPGAFHQFLERCLSSFLPAEAKNDVVSQPPDSTENLERWFKSDSDLESLRKGNEIENSGANSKAHAVNGAADDVGRLALERVLKRLGFTSDVIHPTDKMSTKARDAAWNADLATELDNLAASVASATLSNKSGIGNSLASPIPRDGTDGSDGLGTFEALGPPESPRSRPTDQDQEPWGRH